MLNIIVKGTPRPRGATAPWVRVVREPSLYAEVQEGKVPMRGPRDALRALEPKLAAEDVEVFCVLLLDAQHQCFAKIEVTRGIVNSSLVHPREVFRLAIAMNASAIILAHNHPSGDPTPSADDRAITSQLVAAGRLLDIPIHDHIIVVPGRYVSFAEMGIM